EIRDLLELHTVDPGDLRRVGNVVDVPVVDLLDAVGTKRLHACRAGHGGGGHQLRLAAAEEAAKVHLRVEHEFLPAFAVVPEPGRGVEARCQAVVCGANDAVVEVERGDSDFPVGVFRAEAGDVGQRHRVMGNGQSA